MPTLILCPWLSPTRLSLVPKAAREGYRQNRAMNAGTAAGFGPLSLKTHQWSRLTSASFSHSAAISLRTA
jgi:hypothetical protein